MKTRQGDKWSAWLLSRRFGGDPKRLQAMLETLRPVRERVLDNARLNGEDVLLDVGCGDGFIAFGALERLPTCRAVLSDISPDLLDQARQVAEALGFLNRCRFVRAEAETLAPIADESVDVVTTRSVLIYVADKQAAFNAFYRVLKPGGRFSLFEPINRFGHPEPDNRFWGYDVSPVADLARKLKALYRRLQPPDSDPMLNFDAWDLVEFAERAGFDDIHLEVETSTKPKAPQQWATFVRSAGNPKIPTLEEAMKEVLTPAEREAFTAHLRPLVETGQGRTKMAVAYVWGQKDKGADGHV